MLCESQILTNYCFFYVITNCLLIDILGSDLRTAVLRQLIAKYYVGQLINFI